MKAAAAVLLVLVAAAPVAAQTGSTLVVISVPPTQVLEGATSLAVRPGPTAHRAQLIVKSNTAWTLVARVSGPAAGVAWRAGTGAWVPVEGATAVLSGGRGVHVIAYEVRAQGGQPGLLTLALEAK